MMRYNTGAGPWIAGLFACIAITAIWCATHTLEKHHIRPLDVLGNAQELHSSVDTPAMCRQAGGVIVWAGDPQEYVACHVGNTLGVTSTP